MIEGPVTVDAADLRRALDYAHESERVRTDTGRWFPLDAIAALGETVGWEPPAEPEQPAPRYVAEVRMARFGYRAGVVAEPGDVETVDGWIGDPFEHATTWRPTRRWAERAGKRALARFGRVARQGPIVTTVTEGASRP